MSTIRPTQKIFDVVRDIEDRRYMLPSIQRSFVWAEDRICKLLDSLMSDYPIGSLLVWKPAADLEVRTKEFSMHYKSDSRLLSELKPQGETPYLVLDGQQRLQSLYLAFFGSYDGKFLYFKVDSDPTREPDNLRYQFQFLDPQKVAADPHWVLVGDAAKIREIHKRLR
jgi:uncharacterized protein with ParB-like and HNH nuclease domain